MITEQTAGAWRYHVLWARDATQALHDSLGNWRKVATTLAPHLSVSPSAWWHVSRGKCITKAKINALRAYYGLPPVLRHKTCWRPRLPDPGDDRREELLTKFVKMIKET